MCGRRQGSNNGELLNMYMSGEWVPDVTEAKSCVLVKVLVPSNEQGFFDFDSVHVYNAHEGVQYT